MAAAFAGTVPHAWWLLALTDMGAPQAAHEFRVFGDELDEGASGADSACASHRLISHCLTL